MTPRLSLLFASTVLTAAFTVPTFAALPIPGNAPGQCSGVCLAALGEAAAPAPLLLVSGDNDDDDDEESWLLGWGEDDDEDEDCDDDDGDDCAARSGRGNPAPAGTVAPPANGLFGTGAPPVAVTN